jgi:hypothetical protein
MLTTDDKLEEFVLIFSEVGLMSYDRTIKNLPYSERNPALL